MTYNFFVILPSHQWRCTFHDLDRLKDLDLDMALEGTGDFLLLIDLNMMHQLQTYFSAASVLHFGSFLNLFGCFCHQSSAINLALTFCLGYSYIFIKGVSVTWYFHHVIHNNYKRKHQLGLRNYLLLSLVSCLKFTRVIHYSCH